MNYQAELSANFNGRVMRTERIILTVHPSVTDAKLPSPRLLMRNLVNDAKKKLQLQYPRAKIKVKSIL